MWNSRKLQETSFYSSLHCQTSYCFSSKYRQKEQLLCICQSIISNQMFMITLQIFVSEYKVHLRSIKSKYLILIYLYLYFFHVYNINNSYFYSIPLYLAAQKAFYKLTHNKSVSQWMLPSEREFGSTVLVINLKISSDIGTIVSILPSKCGLAI